MILVVGDVMTDTIVRPDGPAAPGTDRRAIIERRHGGSGANIACWIGRHGTPTRFAGRVGAADVAAHELEFGRHGVLPYLAADATRATGSVVAILGADGERSFFTDRGANLSLCAQDLFFELLDGVRALHISGHVFFTQRGRGAARALMLHASHSGIAISVDAGSVGWLRRSGPAAFRAWTEQAGLCIANREEAEALGGGYDQFVVTDGAHGAVWHRRGETVRVAARPVAEIVDGIGAGDAFAAGLLAARAAGAGEQDCLNQGCDWAARCLGHAGGRPPPDAGAAIPA